MLTLVTTNPAKYAPFGPELERLRIRLAAPKQNLPELQCLGFAEALAAKARAMADLHRRPVLVDDAGLVLEAYPGFPGPLTSAVLRSLGVLGLRQLLHGLTDRAALECHIGCWTGGGLRSWTGIARGRLELSRQPRDQRMMLTELFVPDEPASEGRLPHRARALAALATEAFDLHLETAPAAPAPADLCSPASAYHCPFCVELEEPSHGVFAEMLGDRLPSRIIYEDEHFVLVPPLGQFIEGGLLLLARPHVLSLACLPPERLAHLERLLGAVHRAVVARWGVPPLVFEHGPAPERTKGVCCVDHAHLNIFPARVHLHPHLAQRMNLPLRALPELARLRQAEFGYLFVQENDGSRRVYDGFNVPTQLVRRVIASQLGLAERWHWREYPGTEELLATYHALKGQIRL